MTRGKSGGGQVATPAPEATTTDEPEAADEALEALLDRVAPARIEAPVPTPAAGPGLRTARLRSYEGRDAAIAWRGQAALVNATIDDDVDLALMKRAVEEGDAVLVEVAPGAEPVIVGVLQTRLPSAIELRGETITIEAEREVLIRAGRSAVRLREDGDLEVVGSRISAVSRGLFRIVGRVLRLN
jgi:hypothetical protein